MSAELRQFPRLEQEFPVCFDVVPDTVSNPMPRPAKQGMAKNISGGGLYLVAPKMRKSIVKKLLSHSCRLNLEFYLPDFKNKINVLGEVRWARDGLGWWNVLPKKWEIGVKFIYIGQSDKDSIIKYVINKQIEEQLSKGR